VGNINKDLLRALAAIGAADLRIHPPGACADCRNNQKSQEAEAPHLRLFLPRDGPAFFIKVFTQQNRRSDGVYRWSFARTSVANFIHNLFRFPTGQSFVRQFNRDAQFLAKADREASGFASHLASFARDVQRMADQDVAHAVLTANLAKAPNILTAILVQQNGQRLRRESQFV
jgi:hypothetical protein